VYKVKPAQQAHASDCLPLGFPTALRQPKKPLVGVSLTGPAAGNAQPLGAVQVLSNHWLQ